MTISLIKSFNYNCEEKQRRNIFSIGSFCCFIEILEGNSSVSFNPVVVSRDALEDTRWGTATSARCDSPRHDTDYNFIS